MNPEGSIVEIRSGPSTRRVVRAAVTLLLVNVFAGLFLWDGFVRYPVVNAGQWARSLGAALPVPPPIIAGLTAREAGAFIAQASQGTVAEVLVARWGEPALRHESTWYFLGPGGRLEARVSAGQVQSLEWQDGVHSDVDLLWQRVIGGVLAVVGAGCMVHLIRTVLSFATLSVAGLHVSGRRLIPWEAMTGLALAPKDRFRRIALTYLADGKERVLLLDDEVIRDRDAMVAAICRRKGFADPTTRGR